MYRGSNSRSRSTYRVAHATLATAIILTRSVSEATKPESSLTLRANMKRGQPVGISVRIRRDDLAAIFASEGPPDHIADAALDEVN